MKCFEPEIELLTTWPPSDHPKPCSTKLIILMVYYIQRTQNKTEKNAISRIYATQPLKVLFAIIFASELGCPRNNQIFFSVRTETNQNSICFGCFSVCFPEPKNIFFGLFKFLSVFRTGTETTETNRKNLQKRSLFGGSSKPLVFFLGSNRNKPKLSLFWLFFGSLFRETKNFFFRFVSVCFDVSDRYQNNWNTQNSW
jgi:hypothetical protein